MDEDAADTGFNITIADVVVDFQGEFIGAPAFSRVAERLLVDHAVLLCR